MLISVIISFIITILVFNFAFFSAKIDFFSIKPRPDLKIFNVLADQKGEVLGAREGGINQAVGKVVEEIKEIPLVESILPGNEDRPAGPEKISDADNLEIIAKGVAALDGESGSLLFTYKVDKVTPIASLTKLMTALVFLDYNPGWDFIYEIRKEDKREGGKIYLFPGEKVTAKDLFHLSLVASANTATIALVHSTGLSEEEFVKKMGEKASALGLANTRFSDPIGLSNDNISTAEEIAQLAKVSLAHEDIRQATLIKEYGFKTLGGRKKKVPTTDYLLKNFPDNGLKIIGGKTGYTDLAGYCFVGKFASDSSQEIFTVILGSETSSDRFKQSRDLAEWVYKNYEW